MIIDVQKFGRFTLDRDLLEQYRSRPVRWGFGALSWVTYQRTYSRDGEQWWQTCQRVIEGMFTVQKVHCAQHGLPWDEARAHADAVEAYARMWAFKWLPPGRGLWVMGTQFLYDRGGAALNNCGFISTQDIARDYTAPFKWMLEMSMLGVGVGFDTRGQGSVTIQPAIRTQAVYHIDDSREGWAAALSRLLGAYTGTDTLPAQWDYSAIRPKGTPLHAFGGVASGPEPLQQMLDTLTHLYDSHVDQRVTSTLIVDTMNIIGKCVVAGGIRRSAQIAFGTPDDQGFLNLKRDPQKLRDYRWASNNSILADVGMDYTAVAEHTITNGEPGYLWLSNARAFGRMSHPPDHRDAPAMGSNPCVEQTLWDRELCCLVETYPAHHDNFEDFKATVRLAFQYAKTVTLVPTHDPATNAVMQRNRRIGCSVTGIIQAINRVGYRTFLRWCDRAYDYIQYLDAQYAQKFGVPRSIKTTTVKPSGTVSLLAGATPGVHWDHSPYYLRRIRVTAGHPLVEMCKNAGYHVEPDHYATASMVIAFPVHVPHLGRRKDEVPLWEKVDLAAQMQRYWSDNQVSCTAEFNPETESKHIPQILAAYEDRLKGIAFLPAAKHGYEQPPYEQITKEEYDKLVKNLKPIQGSLNHEEELEARFCEGSICEYEIQ